MIGFFKIDGDAEYDVNDLPRLIKSSHNSDLVITYRYKRKYNTIRIIISVVYNMLLEFCLIQILKMYLLDLDCSKDQF